MKLDKNFLKKYINTPSPSGHEMELGGQKVWIDYVTPFCNKVDVDSYGNAYAYYGNITESTGPIKTVLLDAHADEIGFFVFDITDKGFIKIGTLGGSDITIAPSSRVDIWGNNGKVSGVFGHPAIHVHQREFKSKTEDTFIDIGVSTKEEVLAKGIEIGIPITMSDGYMDLGDYYCGRALDDKIGGFITAQLLKRLHIEGIVLPFQLIVVNAVQEEVGLHGAKMIAQKIKPDLAIVIDVTHDTESPAYNKNLQGSLTAGEGIVIMSAPSLHKNVVKMLKNVAKDFNIPFQQIASGGSSGTNADAYAYPHGIPTGLLKMAMRYMHTTVETVHKKDVDSTIELLYNTLNSERILESFDYTR